MKLNKKSLLVACVLAAMSTSAFAASTTTSTSSTTVTNTDTSTSTSTRVTREQHSTTISTSSTTTSEKTSSRSSNTSVGVGVGIGRLDTFMPIVGAVKQPPAAVKKAIRVLKDDSLLQQGYLGLVKEKGKWGIVGPNGQVVLAPTYKTLDASFKKDGTFYGEEGKNKVVHIKGDGTVLQSGKEAQDALYADTNDRYTAIKEMNNFDPKDIHQSYLSDSYVTFKEKGKLGFKDGAGHVVIQPQFKEIPNVETKFSEDRAFVKADGKVVAIDGQGKVVFTAPSNEVYPYKNGLAEYRRKVSHFGLGGILGLVGMGYLYNHGGVYIDGLGGLIDDGMKRGYIDRNGTIVIDSKNDYVYPMEEHGTLVRNEGKLGFMNRQGQYIIQPGNYEAGTIDMNNVLLTMKNKDTNKYGIFDMETGKQEVPFKYDTIDFVGEHQMSVTNDTNRYVVDMADGRIIYKGDKANTVKSFVGDQYTWIYNKDGNYKILSLDGTVIETPVMKDISGTGTFSHGYSSVKIKGKWGIMNSKGELVVQPTYDEITIL